MSLFELSESIRLLAKQREETGDFGQVPAGGLLQVGLQQLAIRFYIRADGLPPVVGGCFVTPRRQIVDETPLEHGPITRDYVQRIPLRTRGVGILEQEQEVGTAEALAEVVVDGPAVGIVLGTARDTAVEAPSQIVQHGQLPPLLIQCGELRTHDHAILHAGNRRGDVHRRGHGGIPDHRTRDFRPSQLAQGIQIQYRLLRATLQPPAATRQYVQPVALPATRRQPSGPKRCLSPATRTLAAPRD